MYPPGYAVYITLCFRFISRNVFEGLILASKFVCDCGHTVCTNGFEGHAIFRLLSDNEIDALNDPISVQEVTELWFRSPEIIGCKGCGSFFQWDGVGQRYVQYKQVPAST